MLDATARPVNEVSPKQTSPSALSDDGISCARIRPQKLSGALLKSPGIGLEMRCKGGRVDNAK